MATYLDNAGVTQILTKIKSLLAKKAEITAIPTKVSQLTNDNEYVNSAYVIEQLRTGFGKLNNPDSPVAGQYVSAVSQEGGKIKVTRASLPAVGTADTPISNTTIENIFTQVFG